MGCCGYGYFILGHFVARHIKQCMDKISADKISGNKTPVKIARGRGDKMLAILWDREGKMLILSKHFV